MSIPARVQTAAAIVRRLNAAVKSRRLYAAGHPLRAQTVSALLATVTAYHERFGSFVLETHKNGLIVEGKPFEGGESVDNLALQLYGMGVWQLVLLPGLHEAETGELLEIITLDREAILAQGGFVELLSKHNVEHVRVVELKPGEEDPANISLEAYQQLLDGSLQAQDRAALLDVLRGGPEQARRLLSVVVERTQQAFPDATGKDLAGRLYRALTALDRLIVDTPPGESQELMQHLATAVAEMEDPTKGKLPATILARAAEDLSARALLSAMTSGQIARMVIPCLEVGDPPPQVTQVVQGLPLDPKKARETLALISQQTGRSFDVPPLIEELALPKWIRNFPQDLIDFRVTDADVTVSEEEIQAVVAEARVDEDTLAREQLLTLLHLSAEERDPRELEANLEALVRSAGAQLQGGAYEVVLPVLRELDTLAMEAGPRAEPGRAALRHLLGLVSGMVTVKDVWLWTDEQPLLAMLRQVGRSAATLFAQALTSERDPGRRQVIAAILVKLGEDNIDSLTPYLSDQNPEVVRHIVHVLAQMRSAKAIAALKVAARHPDSRIRRETVDALRPVQMAEAQDALLAFLQDQDLQIRELCLASLRPETARRVSGDLLTMLQGRDLRHAVSLRTQIIKTLVRARAVEAVPVLTRIGSPFKLRRRDRELARHARAAVTTLSRMPAGTSGVRRGVPS